MSGEISSAARPASRQAWTFAIFSTPPQASQKRLGVFGADFGGRNFPGERRRAATNPDSCSPSRPLQARRVSPNPVQRPPSLLSPLTVLRFVLLPLVARSAALFVRVTSSRRRHNGAPPFLAWVRPPLPIPSGHCLKALPGAERPVSDDRDFIRAAIWRRLVGGSALGEHWDAAALAGVGSFVGEGLDLSGDEPYSSHGRELLVGLF